MDIETLIAEAQSSEQEPCYPERIKAIQNKGWDESLIERGIADTVRVLESGAKSFVVYGEPQSGKTEFMIALSCKLIDMGYQTIFIVMNDNVELERQNFGRFHRTRELRVTPIQDFQVLKMQDNELRGEKQRIIFCRKNKANLKKLVYACRFMGKRILIDDEADYATPNGKINKEKVTAINEWVGKLGDLKFRAKELTLE
jgi:type IV secretory pathway ATPase VirB11/archaellum biosynthesis ATPase